MLVLHISLITSPGNSWTHDSCFVNYLSILLPQIELWNQRGDGFMEAFPNFTSVRQNLREFSAHCTTQEPQTSNISSPAAVCFRSDLNLSLLAVPGGLRLFCVFLSLTLTLTYMFCIVSRIVCSLHHLLVVRVVTTRYQINSLCIYIFFFFQEDKLSYASWWGVHCGLSQVNTSTILAVVASVSLG